MKTKKWRTFDTGFHRKRGFLMVDLLVGMAILTLAIMPLAFSFVHERQLLRAEYFRAAAVEIVDGEMEILAAGEWRNFPNGSQAYAVHAQAAAGLPPGHFQLTKSGKHLRLEWKSDEPRGIGPVVREITVR
jgi:type II secretory pathway pseudopilin PulG